MKRLKEVLSYHRIKSLKIFRYGLSAFFSVLILLIISDLTVGLQTTFQVLSFFAIIAGGMLIMTAIYGDPKWLMNLFVLTVYATLEYHSLAIPKISHVAMYWWFFIPAVALVFRGVRASFLWLFICVVSILVNVFYLESGTDGSYETVVVVRKFMVVGIIFLFSAFSGILLLYKLLSDAYSNLHTKSDALESLKLKLESSLTSIIELSNNPAVHKGDIQTVYQLICKLSAETLQVSRVSIWDYKEDQAKIERTCLYEKQESSNDKVELYEKNFPNYFNAVKSKNVVSATNARTDPKTMEFTNSYLIPTNIYSMLDSSFMVDRKFAGVICCEHQHEVHQWTPEDILLLRSMSDVVSMVHNTHQINEFSNTVQEQNATLTLQKKEIEKVNNKLKNTNDELEERVIERTQVLEKKNSQLAEYAFVNSHLLRAPLSRILGLSYIIAKDQISIKDKDLLDALITSTEELDKVIRKISDLLYDGSNFDREEIIKLIEENIKGKPTAV